MENLRWSRREMAIKSKFSWTWLQNTHFYPFLHDELACWVEFFYLFIYDMLVFWVGFYYLIIWFLPLRIYTWYVLRHYYSVLTQYNSSSNPPSCSLNKILCFGYWHGLKLWSLLFIVVIFLETPKNCVYRTAKLHQSVSSLLCALPGEHTRPPTCSHLVSRPSEHNPHMPTHHYSF